jgi:hypothetical protein
MGLTVSIFDINETPFLTWYREDAIKNLAKNPFFADWDNESLRIYVECGTTPTRDLNGNPVIRLKMLGIHEAMVFSETHTESEVYQRFPELDERIELLWIVPGHPEAIEYVVADFG